MQTTIKRFKIVGIVLPLLLSAGAFAQAPPDKYDPSYYIGKGGVLRVESKSGVEYKTIGMEDQVEVSSQSQSSAMATSVVLVLLMVFVAGVYRFRFFPGKSKAS